MSQAIRTVYNSVAFSAKVQNELSPRYNDILAKANGLKSKYDNSSDIPQELTKVLETLSQLSRQVKSHAGRLKFSEELGQFVKNVEALSRQTDEMLQRYEDGACNAEQLRQWAQDNNAQFGSLKNQAENYSRHVKGTTAQIQGQKALNILNNAEGRLNAALVNANRQDKGKGPAEREMSSEEITTFTLWLKDLETRLNKDTYLAVDPLVELEDHKAWLELERTKGYSAAVQGEIVKVSVLLDRRIRERKQSLHVQNKQSHRIIIDGQGNPYKIDRDGEHRIPTSQVDRDDKPVYYSLFIHKGRPVNLTVSSEYDMTSQQSDIVQAEAIMGARQLIPGHKNFRIRINAGVTNPQTLAEDPELQRKVNTGTTSAARVTRVLGLDKQVDLSKSDQVVSDVLGNGPQGVRKPAEQKSAQPGGAKVSRSLTELDTYGKAPQTPAYPENGTQRDKYRWDKLYGSFYQGIAVSANRQTNRVKAKMQVPELRPEYLKPLKSPKP